MRFVVWRTLREAQAARIAQRRAEAGCCGQLHQSMGSNSQPREQRTRHGDTGRCYRGQRRGDNRREHVMM